MPARKRSSRRRSGRVSAILFNLGLFALFYTASLLIIENRRALGEEYVTSKSAVQATRNAMSGMFRELVPPDANPRTFWANRIENELRDSDLASARGYMLAAPDMLATRDVNALLAAANAERSGTEDERLLSAASLFLPDDVRALYERALSPSRLETPHLPEATDAEGTVPEVEPASLTVSEEVSVQPIALSADARAPEPAGFFVLGSERELAYRSADWVRGDDVDLFSLKLSGLGLALQAGRIEDGKAERDVLRGASLIKSASRADRLSPEFHDVLEKRLSNAIPTDRLGEELEATFQSGGSLLINGDAVLDAFERATETNALAPLLSDFRRISQLGDGRSNTAALTILETIESLSDLKRAELITRAGGDRAVTLTKRYGRDALNAATTVMDWSFYLVALILLNLALLAALGWIALTRTYRFLRHLFQTDGRYTAT